MTRGRISGVMAAFLVTTACDVETDKVAGAQPVAMVDAYEVSVGMVKQALGKGRRSTALQRKRVVDQLVRHALMVNEAHRRRLETDPRVRRQIEEVLAKALAARVKAKARAAVPSGDEVARMQRKLAKGARQERVRASVVWATSEAIAKTISQELTGRASQLLRVVRANPGVAGARSGDLGFIDAESKAPVRQAIYGVATSLAKIGAVSGPMEIGGRWAVVVKTGHISPRRLDPKSLSRRARESVLREHEVRAVERLIETLRLQTKITIDDKLISDGDWQ